MKRSMIRPDLKDRSPVVFPRDFRLITGKTTLFFQVCLQGAPGDLPGASDPETADLASPQQFIGTVSPNS